MYKLFKNKLEKAVEENQAFVLLNLPNTSTIQLWVNNSQQANQKIVLHAFNNKNEQVIYDDDVCELEVEQFDFSFVLDLPLTHQIPMIDKNIYLKTIQKTIDFIKESMVEKVVISRPKIIPKPSVNALISFKNLVKKHSQALVYLWHVPNQETWLAATPELLLKTQENTFKTVALAGTKLPNKEWTPKEMVEQQLVTDYIVKTLNNETNIKVDGPHTILAGDFEHLKSYISGKFIEKYSAQTLVKKLHPTPAVCGLPKEESFNFINQTEGYNRSFYTGYIGVEKGDSTEYYVNLRCAQLFKNEAVAFVGGGILANSNPLHEWEETELKSNIIISALA